MYDAALLAARGRLQAGPRCDSESHCLGGLVGLGWKWWPSFHRAVTGLVSG